MMETKTALLSPVRQNWLDGWERQTGLKWTGPGGVFSVGSDGIGLAGQNAGLLGLLGRSIFGQKNAKLSDQMSSIGQNNASLEGLDPNRMAAGGIYNGFEQVLSDMGVDQAPETNAADAAQITAENFQISDTAVQGDTGMAAANPAEEASNISVPMQSADEAQASDQNIQQTPDFMLTSSMMLEPDDQGNLIMKQIYWA